MINNPGFNIDIDIDAFQSIFCITIRILCNGKRLGITSII